MLQLIINLLAVTGILTITGLLLIRGPIRLQRAFAWFTLLTATWILVQALAQFWFNDQALMLIRISTVISLLMPLFFHIFVDAYTIIPGVNKPTLFVLFVLASSLGLLNFSSFGINHVLADPSGIAVDQAGAAYTVSSILVVIVFGFELARLIQFRTNSREIHQKKRTSILIGGLVFSLVLSAVSAVFFASSTSAQVLIPFSFLVFVSTVYYAIAKHKLFEIRFIIARSVAYVLMLLTTVGLYTGIVYATSSIFFDVSHLGWTARITYALAAVFIAFTFQPFKQIIDRVTGKLFFRDSYDSQLTLDQLSSLLAREIDLEKIVVASSNLISSALKPNSLRFAVFKDGETYIDHLVSTNRKRALLRPEIDEIEHVLVVRDEAETKVKRYLDHYDAEILLKLRTNEETVGAILLGPKQSGTVYSKQDIDLLTISEKELAIAVQNSRYFEQIQEFNVKLQQEVMDATSELRATNEKLKALDEAKDEFISMASHQLRTPLTSVKGYISMVMEGDAGQLSKDQKKLLDEAFSSSQRMVYLIADLLNVSRLKTGKFIIEPGEVYLPDIVEQEINQLKPTARSRRLNITYQKPSRFPHVWLDETKIRQVIMNFIDNAIYYTPAGGKIEVQLIAKRTRIEYRVVDNGIGIPKSDQPKLFAKFFRAGNARKARPDGTGLGLYMAQRVVSAQGGSILFASKEGQGSTFGFSFPLTSIKTKPAALRRIQSAALPPESDE